MTPSRALEHPRRAQQADRVAAGRDLQSSLQPRRARRRLCVACAACAQRFSAALALGAADARRGAPHRRDAPRQPLPRAPPSVAAALSGLQRAGAITPAQPTRSTTPPTSPPNARWAGSAARAARNSARCIAQRRRRWPPAASFIAVAPAGDLPHAERNRRWWTTEPLLSSGERVSFPGSRSSCGSTTPARASRSSGWARSARPTATSCRATKTPTCASCCPKSSRSRPSAPAASPGSTCSSFDGGRAAVDERALAGHRAAGARARVVALQGTGAADRRPAGARHLPERAAAAACASRRRPAPSTPSTPTRPATASSTASSRPSSACTTTRTITKDPLGLQAVRSGRRRGARGGRRTTTRAPGRCTTSSANRTSTTTNCSPNSCSTCANARAKARRMPLTRAAPPPPTTTTTTPTPTTPSTTTTPRRPPAELRRAPAPRAPRLAARRPARAHADRRRSGLLHDRAELHDDLEDPAGRSRC